MGWNTYGNTFNSQLFDEDKIGVLPPTGSGQELITNYINVTSGSVINYYDEDFTTLGFIVQLLDPGSPYPINNHGQEIYKRIFANMVSLVKRKGTITGLRQLINIWGVPATMLRISEFGGKNKDDENDYDLFQDRYSTAFTSYAVKNTESVAKFGVSKTSACVSVPWQCLTGNFLDVNTRELSPADCIQFRFKPAEKVGATTNISRSLLLKQGNPYSTGASTPTLGHGEFGIMLEQSGSAKGTYSGSINSDFNTYASMSFVISGSVAQGASGTGYFKSPPIYLPFFNGDFWSVQFQRLTHISQSTENETAQTFELRVGQIGYDGYDGNSIKYTGITTMSFGATTASVNEAWNKMEAAAGGVGDDASMNEVGESHLLLPGSIAIAGTILPFNFIGAPGILVQDRGLLLGDSLSGSFQELRYYRRAISQSAFNDYVMNPESIQGMKDRFTGSFSSYDLLSFRAPLGNELEFTAQGKATASHHYNNNTYFIHQFYYGNIAPFESTTNRKKLGRALGSVHPSYGDGKSQGPIASLYTSSFINKANTFFTSSTFNINYRILNNYGPASMSISASYLEPVNEVVYLDQPAAGLRNRINNKIQVLDRNEYGNVLKYQRSVQQNPIQSQSYSENINSLEVGFSFQNEINDDIIATYGHGVVSNIIGDPRQLSQSGDRYPGLTKIAEDYFKKYQGVNIYSPQANISGSILSGGVKRPTRVENEFDYNRLLKFYETSLFKAIKNYMPARTSLNTGIIIKPHLLERNRHKLASITPDTTIAKTPETGSLNNATSSLYGGLFDEATITGFNSPMVFRNLQITGSVSNFQGGNETIIRPSAGSGLFSLNSIYSNTPLNSLNSLYTASRANTYPWYSGFGNGIEIPNKNVGGIDTLRSIMPGIMASSSTQLAGIDNNSLDLTPAYFYGKEFYDSPAVTSSLEDTFTQLANGSATSATGFWNMFINKNVVPYFLESQFDENGSQFSAQSNNSGSIVPLNNIITNFRYGITLSDKMRSSAFGDGNIVIEVRSNKRGVIDSSTFDYAHTTQSFSYLEYETDDYVPVYNNEALTFHIKVTNANYIIANHQIEFGGKFVKFELQAPTLASGSTPWISYNETQSALQVLDLINNDPNKWASQQGWFEFIDTKEGMYSTSFHDYQDEFYNGEYSGSTLTYTPKNWNCHHQVGGASRYNPYRILHLESAPVRHPIGPTASFEFDPFSNPVNKVTMSFTASQNNFNEVMTSSHAMRFIFSQTVTNNTFNADGSINVKASTGGLGEDTVDNFITVLQNSAQNFKDPAHYFKATKSNSLFVIIQQYGTATSVTDTSVITYDPANPTIGSNRLLELPTASGFGGGFFSSSIDNTTPLQYLNCNDAFKFPLGSSESFFRYSNYNPLINNVSSSRTNKFYQNVEYATSQFIPNNLSLIQSGSASLSTVPESYYTTTKIINPRYDGSRISSFDYNNFNTSGSTLLTNLIRSFGTNNAIKYGGEGIASISPINLLGDTFLNGDTGSWGGDNSFGKTATIDKNPIYIAHFKSSITNPTIYNTRTFEIDTLIQVPSTPLQFVSPKTKGAVGKGANPIPQVERINPVTIDIDGSNEELLTVANNFEKNRFVSWNFISPTKDGKNFDILSKGEYKILNPSSNFKFLVGNQPVRNDYVHTMSFFPPEPLSLDVRSNGFGGTAGGPSTAFFVLTDHLISTFYTGSNKFIAVEGDRGQGINSGQDIPNFRTGSGCLYLRGPKKKFAAGNPKGSGGMVFTGPGLLMIHALNNNVSLNRKNSFDIFGTTFPVNISLSFAEKVVLEPDNPEFYFRQCPIPGNGFPTATSSMGQTLQQMTSFPNEPEPFLIKRGDIIRVQYPSTGSGQVQDLVLTEQEFTVLDVRDSSFDEGVIDNNEKFTCQATVNGGATSNYTPSTGKFDKLIVTPDPSQLEAQVVSGSISLFTIFRREDDDRKLVVEIPGNQTLYSQSVDETAKSSPAGYLVPKDMSLTQKQNALEIINQLNEKNAFKADTDFNPNQSKG